MNPLAIITSLISPITTIVGNWQEKKKIEAEGWIAETKALQDAKVRHLEQTTTAEIDWDMLAMKNSNSSWKDEWILVCFTIPFIMAFVPGLQGFALDGFHAIDQMPIWFKSAWGVIIAASYGYQKYANHQYKMT